MSTVTPPGATSPSRRPAASTVTGGAPRDRSAVNGVAPAARAGTAAGRGRAALIAAAALVVTAVAVLSAVRSTSPWSIVVAALVVVWAVSGAVAARPGGIRALGLVMVGLAAVGAAASYAAVDAPTDDVAALVRSILLPALVGVSFHLAVVLPTGIPASRRRRWLVVVGYLGVVPLAVESARRRPDVASSVAVVTIIVLGGVALAAFVAACSRAGNRDRARLQWDGWGVLVAMAVAGGVWSCAALIGWPPRPAMVVASSTVLVPIGLVASTSEHGLARAGKVLVHTIVVVGLVALVSSIYLAVVVGLGGLPDERERTVMALSLAAAALAALLVVPARTRLVEFANQRVYGERTAPDTALRTFATRMSRSVPMDELLLQLVESLRQTMGLSCAEVWTGGDGVFERQVSVPRRGRVQLALGREELEVATRTRVVGNGWLSVWLPALLEGRDDRRLRVAPIAHLGELLGFIVCERVEDAPAFDEEEDRVLADLTRQVGLALHNVRLDSALQASLDELQVRNLELQASRARIVAASDEARRRIERNLHDGAQQHLVAMAVKLGLARQLLSKDPAVADGLLEELRSDVQVTVGELRELAHGIYPPLLRDRGLGEALRAAANRSPLPAEVEVQDIGRFDTDLEAAVYFCCLEAMQNAGKHAAGATALLVTIVRSPGRVSFSVHDDGAGFDVRHFIGGHGFTNMEDRLGAIGGELAVASEPGVGTTISGWVPVADEPTDV